MKNWVAEGTASDVNDFSHQCNSFLAGMGTNRVYSSYCSGQTALKPVQTSSAKQRTGSMSNTVLIYILCYRQYIICYPWSLFRARQSNYQIRRKVFPGKEVLLCRGILVKLCESNFAVFSTELKIRQFTI